VQLDLYSDTPGRSVWAQLRSLEMLLRIDLPNFLLDIETEWTPNKTLLKFSG